MAKSITKRTLLGYTDGRANLHYFDDLINMLRSKPQQFVRKVLKPSYWDLTGVSEMKFDAVVGNPPYQGTTGGGVASGKSAAQARPIFQFFVEQAKQLVPEYISMIIPARWYNGGMALDAFRESMLGDERIVALYDYYNSKECFQTVDIAGGICYFLWQRTPSTSCAVINVIEGKRNTTHRKLNQFGNTFIRDNRAISIINKVTALASHFMDEIVSPLDTFGLPSKEKGHELRRDGDIELIHSVGFNDQSISYIERDRVKKNAHLIDKYKVKISIMVPQGGEVGIRVDAGYRSISTPQVLKPGQVDTFSYLNIGFLDTEEEAVNLQKYMKCRFSRFMLRTTFSSVHISKGNFAFVPLMDLKREWTDESLFSYFGLSEEERNLIIHTMRPID